MKIIELSSGPLAVEQLIDAANGDEVLLMRNGHPVVRIERYSDADWEEWQVEHSPEAIEKGKAAKVRDSQGLSRPIDEVWDELDAVSKD